MADELTIKVSAKLDENSVSAIQSQIDDIGKNNKEGIKLQLDKSITTQINKLKNSLNQISSKVYPIKIQIDQTAISNIQDLTNSLNKAVANVQSTVSRQATFTKQTFDANKGVPNNGYVGTSRLIQRGKIDELNGFEATSEIEKRNLALGETLTIYRELKKEQDDEIGRMEETSRQYETNYELQAKEAAKAHDQAIKEEAKYRTYIEKENEKAQKEQEALNKRQQQEQAKAEKDRGQRSSMYAGLYDQIDRKEAQEEKKARDYERRELEKALKEEEKQIKLQQQQELALQKEHDRQQQSLSSFFVGEGNKTDTYLTGWQSSLNKLYSEAFGRENSLTGDFAKPVEESIDRIQKKIDSFRQTGTLITNSVKNEMKAELDALNTLYKEQYDKNYPDTKQKSVDTRESVERYTSRLNKSENELQKMGMLSEQIKTNIDEVREGFASVEQEDGDSLGQWVDKFGTLQQKIAEFKSSTEGQSMKLNFEIESDKLSQIDALTEKINSLPESMSGSGVAALKEELSGIALGYQDLMSQLQTGDITNEQFAEISNKVKELDDRLNQAANAAKIFQDGFKNEQALEKYSLNVENLKNRFERLKQKYEEFLDANPDKANSDLEEMFDRVGESIKNVDPTNITTVTGEVRNLATAVNNTVTPVQSLGQILTQNFGGIGQYLARFTSAAFIISKVIGITKKMVGEVTSVDSSLVELQKVTTLTGESLDQFVDKAYNVGEGLGRTGKDVVDAVTTFSRAGYDLSQATDLAQSALVMSNVGVDIPNMEAAASDMISILKAYDIQAEDSMQVIDELYNVANKEPLDFGNITDMLVTAGGTLAQTNTTLEETMGLLTGGFATLRDNSVANGLVMISQRLRGVKEDGEAMEADFVPKLKKAFADVGISIEDQNGELRSTFDILQDLAARWDELDSKQRQYLGEKAAGNRQVKVLNAIMANWDVVQDTIDKANEATGAATEGNEKYLDSIQGRITAFQSAFQNLARTTIDSGFVKSVVQLGTNIVNLTTKMGGLIPVIGSIVGAITILKAAKIADGITNIGKAITGLLSGLSGLGSLTTTLSSGIGLAGGLLTAISVIATIVSLAKNASSSFDQMKSKVDEASNSYNDQKEKVSNLNTQLQDTQKLINDLESKDSLTVVEEAELDRLKDLNNELKTNIQLEEAKLKLEERGKINTTAEAYASWATSSTLSKEYDSVDYDKQNNALTRIRNLQGLAQTGAFVDKTIKDLTNRGSIFKPNDNREEINNAIIAIDYAREELGNVQRQINELNSEYLKASENGNKVAIEKSEHLLELANAEKDYYEVILEQNLAVLNEYSNQLGDLIGDTPYISDPSTQSEALVKQLQDTKNTIDDTIITGTLDSINSVTSYLMEKYSDQFDQIKEIVEHDGEISYESLIANFPEVIAEFEKYGAAFGVTADNVTRHINETLSTVDEEGQGQSIVSSIITDLIEKNFLATESYKNLSAAMSEQEKAGSITMETYQKLMSDEGLPGISKYLELTANGFALNTEALYGYIEAQNEDQKLKALEQIEEKRKAIAELQEEYQRLQGAELEEQRAANIDTRNQYEQQIAELSAYIREIDSATTALQRFKAAQNTPNKDADYTGAQKEYETIKEGYKSGKVGTDDYESAMSYFLGEGWLDRYSTDKEAYNAASKIGKRYYADEQKGASNYINDLKKLGIVSEKDGVLSVNENELTGKAYTLEEIGQKLGATFGKDSLGNDIELTAEAVGDLFDLLNTYSRSTNQFEFTDQLSDEEQAELEKRKEEIEDQQNLVDQLNKDKAEAESTVADYEAKGDTESAGYQEAKQKLEEVTAASETAEQELQHLEEGTEVNVDTMTVQEMLELFMQLKEYSDGGFPMSISMQGNYEKLKEILTGLGVLKEETGTPTEVGVTVTGDPDETLDRVKDDLDEVGEGAEADIGVNDADWQSKMPAAHDELLEFDESEASADLGADDADWQSKMPAAHDELLEFDESEASADINANDNTQDGIDTAKQNLDTSFATPKDAFIDAIARGIEAADAAIQNIADKKRTATITVKTEEEVPVTGDEPNYVDNSWVDENGQLRGYKGLLPYDELPKPSSDFISEDDISNLQSYINFLNNLDQSEMSDDGLEQYKADLQEAIDKLEELKRLRAEQSKSDNESPEQPTPEWQKDPLVEGEVEGAESGGAIPSAIWDSWEEDAAAAGEVAGNAYVESFEGAVNNAKPKMPEPQPEGDLQLGGPAEEFIQNYQATVESALETSKENIGLIMEKLFGDPSGNGVDLLNRPQISGTRMAWEGYEGFDKNSPPATVFSQSEIIGENGNVGVMLTPIMPDGTVVSKENMDKVFENLFVGENGEIQLPDGFTITDLVGDEHPVNLSDLLISSFDLSGFETIEDKIAVMESLGELLHQLQEGYYGNDDNDNNGTETPEVDNGGAEGTIGAEGATEGTVEVGVEATEDAGEAIVNNVQDQVNEEPPVKIEEEPAPESTPTTQPTDVTTSTSQPVSPVEGETVAFNTEAADGGQGVLAQVQATADANPVEVTVEEKTDNLNTDDLGKVGSHISDLAPVANSNGAWEEMSELTDAYLNLSDAQSKLKSIDPGDTAAYDAASSELSSAASNFNTAYDNLVVALNGVPTPEIDADTSLALAKIAALDTAASQPQTKTVTVQVQGSLPPGNAKGTTNAQKGLSLVDEEGAELIEHPKRGTYELGTNNGARFTNLDKGDIVHTAKETKTILSRMARLGGLFRNGLNQGKSIIGNAFATGVSGSISLENIKRVIRGVQGSSSGSSSSSKSKSSGGSGSKKFKEWAEKLFDWAEIRLARLKTITQSWLLSAAEAIGYIAKNKELTSAIKAVEDEIDATSKAYDLYRKQADKVQKKAKLSAAIVKKIQEGDIKISSYSKEMQEKIKEYQTWYDKAQSCVEALSDLREQEKQLATQKLDNIIQHYDNRIQALDNTVRLRESQLALATAQGRELQSSEYDVSIDATTKKLENLVAQRDALQSELDTLISQGLIEKESDTWFEYQSKLDDVSNSIIETKTAIIELYDTANNVNLTKLGYKLDALTNSASRMNDMMSLHTAQGIEEVAEAYKDLIDNGMDQIKNLEQQNAELRKQQVGLDVLSEKYQDLESQIQQNISTIDSMKVSQEEWNDSVLDLKIKQLEDYRNKLSKTNEQYERQKELREAIEDLEKAQGQRTQKVYREGIGFTFEADQDAVKDAQEKLEDVIENQLLSRIDDLIDALNEQKDDTNVYDAEGNLLGTQYNLPQLGTLSEILSNYYDSNTVPLFSGLKGSLYDQIVAGASSSKSMQFTFGDINLSEVNDVNALGEAIIDMLPNAILQAMNSK